MYHHFSTQLLKTRNSYFNKSIKTLKSFCIRNITSSAYVKHVENELTNMTNAGTYKVERIISSAQASHISLINNDTKVLNFCANNYLGLSNNDLLIKSGQDTMNKYGYGLSSVRFICGTQDIHKSLENEIANFHELEDAILYASCFDANAGLFEVLLNDQDAVISDSLNHASMIDGIRLCKAKRYRYKHMDLADLERCLIDAQQYRHRMIATDGVFSMDGHIAPLEDICNLAEKYDAMVMIDECHATGFYGKTGKGTPEATNTTGRIDIINSTLGKAMGGATGGYTAASSNIVKLLSTT